MKFVRLMVLLFIGSFSVSGLADEWEWRYGVEMEFFEQDETQWCWAAVSKAVILQQAHKRAGMCNLAGRYHIEGGDRATDYCCRGNNSSSSRCNKPGFVHKPLSQYGIYAGYAKGAPSTDKGKEEMRNGNPMVIDIGWTNSSGDFLPVGHAVVVYGIGKPRGFSLNGNIYYVWDPGRNKGKRSMTATEITRAYSGKGRWRATHFTKRNR